MISVTTNVAASISSNKQILGDSSSNIRVYERLYLKNPKNNSNSKQQTTENNCIKDECITWYVVYTELQKIHVNKS